VFAPVLTPVEKPAPETSYLLWREAQSAVES